MYAKQFLWYQLKLSKLEEVLASKAVFHRLLSFSNFKKSMFHVKHWLFGCFLVFYEKCLTLLCVFFDCFTWNNRALRALFVVSRETIRTLLQNQSRVGGFCRILLLFYISTHLYVFSLLKNSFYSKPLLLVVLTLILLCFVFKNNCFTWNIILQ